MITVLFTYFHIRFQKSHRGHVIMQLATNFILLQLWHLKKHFKGLKRPIVHLYAICWNEEKIIPFFLQHYNEFVDHYYIYDNYSDDATDSLLAAQSHVTVRKYDTRGTINDITYQTIKNTAWKQSRGKADWVIVCDMDELLYHPEMEHFLTNNKRYSLFKPTGYNMFSEVFPVSDQKITTTIKAGMRDDTYDKIILFNPYHIVDINYEPGAHDAYPEGIINLINDGQLKLLHYKNIGIDYVMNRIYIYRKRLSTVNKEHGWGSEYNEADRKIIEYIKSSLKQVIQVI